MVVKTRLPSGRCEITTVSFKVLRQIHNSQSRRGGHRRTPSGQKSARESSRMRPLGYAQTVRTSIKNANASFFFSFFFFRHLQPNATRPVYADALVDGEAGVQDQREVRCVPVKSPKRTALPVSRRMRHGLHPSISSSVFREPDHKQPLGTRILERSG